MLAISGGINMSRHGEQKDERYSFWRWAIACVLWCVPLYFGGFFASLGVAP